MASKSGNFKLFGRSDSEIRIVWLYKILTKHNTNVTEHEMLRNFEERLHQKRGVTEASGKKSTSRASLRELKTVSPFAIL